VFGEETRVGNKAWLVKRIIWRLQALAEGDLSERARRRAAELAQDADLRLSPPRQKHTASASIQKNGRASALVNGHLPLPGTILTRWYKGQTLKVQVLRHGFEYDGQVYKWWISPWRSRNTKSTQASCRQGTTSNPLRP
jgi:hypothetical protein